ncbi:hypothetical protein B9Z55_022674 [Caenorhabditis nigoni]|uniref:Uncharacterized protein n=1 Tax=Caenorhabditis nigoni TaxID=1611254 RepID=A0A2G5SL61_9PELO|nr:hypothetical protein B9Z55_022674 [Caenorhabditis nigoni]
MCFRAAALLNRFHPLSGVAGRKKDAQVRVFVYAQALGRRMVEFWNVNIMHVFLISHIITNILLVEKNLISSTGIEIIGPIVGGLKKRKYCILFFFEFCKHSNRTPGNSSALSSIISIPVKYIKK